MYGECRQKHAQKACQDVEARFTQEAFKQRGHEEGDEYGEQHSQHHSGDSGKACDTFGLTCEQNNRGDSPWPNDQWHGERKHRRIVLMFNGTFVCAVFAACLAFLEKHLKRCEEQ